jgi:SAM-dependent methyltransferase
MKHNYARKEKTMGHSRPRREQLLPSAVESIYDLIAEKWARDEPKVHDDLIGRPLVLEMVRRLGKDKIVLDCGCGDGNVCRLVSPFVDRVIGVDSSSRMLAEAQKRSGHLQNVAYIRGRLENLGSYVGSETIDICLALYAVCCIASIRDLRRVFRQIHSVLKPGGYAIIQIPHPLDGLLQEPSSWFEEVDELGSYFRAGELIRRKLKTVDGEWLLVARYHYPISSYFTAISSSGLLIMDLLEPKPSKEVIERYPTLSREAKFPASMIFVTQRAFR